MSGNELSRMVRARPLPAQPVMIEADASERAALALRFGIPAVHSLHAEISLEERDGAVRATGRLEARIEQNCAISGEEFEVAITEPLALRFVEGDRIDPALTGDQEIELDADELDEIEYSGEAFDLGEAVAQSLGLAIDPYAEGPNADAARRAAGITGDGAAANNGPLAEALAALRKG